MNFDEVVALIRCPTCRGRGWSPESVGRRPCEDCGESGINPAVLEEAGGWGTWAISVHDSPGWIVAVNVGLEDPTGRAIPDEPWSHVGV